VTTSGNYDPKRKVLRLFVVTVALLLSVFVLVTYRWQNERLGSELATLRQAAIKTYYGVLNRNAEMLAATMTGLQSNDALRDAFAARDKAALLRLTGPLFERLKTERRITHFYFIRPDHTVLLRVHMPQRADDVIDRFTLQEAERTQAISQGVELGVVGTFTLRVVTPWTVDGRLLGYMELGMEIDGVSEVVKRNLNLRTEILIDKTLLHRRDWEAGMTMLKRPPQWDQFDHWVLNGDGLGPLPAAAAHHLNQWQPDKTGNLIYSDDNGGKLLLDTVPLSDASHRQVGALVIERDVSGLTQALWRSVGMVALFCVVCCLLASVAFWIILSKFERMYGHSEEKLRAMFDMSPFGMALSSLDDRFIEVNPAFSAMVGHPADDLTTMTMADLTPARFREEDRRQKQTLMEQRRNGPYVKELIRRDGHRVSVSLNGMLIKGSDGRTYAWTLVEDISERLAAERTLRRRTEELARSNAELEAFAYVTSHDLRQPLRSISGYVTLLERHYGEHLDEEGRQFIRFVVDGVKRMDRLIIDVLDYARIGRITKPMADTALTEIAAEVVFNLRAAIDEAGASLSVDVNLPLVWADRTEMVRLLQNLITNALKFRAPERPAKIAIRAEDRDGETVVVVEDNGIGIAPADTVRVFGIFQRLHSRDQYEGTGIGLAVCKKIVEHHLGRIWVEAAEPFGSRFCFTVGTYPSGQHHRSDA
jgi:PAS domain S-box-containing protein